MTTSDGRLTPKARARLVALALYARQRHANQRTLAEQVQPGQDARLLDGIARAIAKHKGRPEGA